MKKIITIFLLSTSISVSAQKKNADVIRSADTTAKDTIIVLTVQQASELINDIQIQMTGRADIKNEQWVKDLQMIYESARITPKSDKPNTTK